MIIRDERPGEIAAIHALVTEAFLAAPHASGTEGAIVDALRADDALTLSLVAMADGALAGHAAFSPVLIDGEKCDWFGLGPVAVSPASRRRGIGHALVEAGLKRLQALGAGGCVVLGDPAYYGRFGFANDPALRFADAPAEYFQMLRFTDEAPRGDVVYHPAFYAG